MGLRLGLGHVALLNVFLLLHHAPIQNLSVWNVGHYPEAPK